MFYLDELLNFIQFLIGIHFLVEFQVFTMGFFPNRSTWLDDSDLFLGLCFFLLELAYFFL